LDDKVSVEKARAKGHVHIDEVVQRAHLLKNEAILFTHRSVRYGNEWAEARFKEVLPADLWERSTVLPFAAPWT
jgi:ribonuclease BN (tRNA processing enzyme)